MEICKNKVIDAESERYIRKFSLSPLRKAIAIRMADSKQTIPHFRVTKDIEIDAVLILRKKINLNNPDIKVSINDLVLKASALALIEWPEINSQFYDDQIHQFSQADISVVVAVEGGLATPVLRCVNDKSVQTVATELADFVSRASKGQLKAPEITGGSFTISNLGMYEVDQFDAIINPPQVAILALGRAKKKVVVKGGSMVIRSIMRVSLSLDHRVIDGAVAAGFLTTLASYLENPECLLA